jgi:hypothetical protein
MTQDEIIEMARQVIDLNTDKRGHHTFVCDEYGLEAFAKLVAAKEREAVQHRVDTLHEMFLVACRQRDELMDDQRSQVAAIRARGEA